MKKAIPFIIILLVAAIVGVSVYFITSKNNNKTDVKEKPETSNNETTQEPEEEVTYLEYPEASDADKEILERYSNNNDYKIIKVSGSKFQGYLIAVYEPERMHVVASSKIGTAGEYVTEIVEDNNALLGINAGGFADPNFDGDGGTPLGITVTKNKMIARDKYVNGKSSGVIGFNVNNKLILGNFNSEETISNGIRDCVSFAPFLIKDGETQSLTLQGALGPSSRTARTIIGQREDGIVLLLVVDGDRTKGEGATLGEMTEIMKKYGAVNAANLDGGTSSQMVVGSQMINDPTSLNGQHRSRPVATAFILDSDESDNGDKSVITK